MKSDDKTKAHQGQIRPRRRGHADLLGRRGCAGRTWYTHCEADAKISKCCFTALGGCSPSPRPREGWHRPAREATSAGPSTRRSVSPSRSAVSSRERQGEGQRDGVCLPKDTGETGRRDVSTKPSGPHAWGLSTCLHVPSSLLDPGHWPEEMGKVASVLLDPAPGLLSQTRPACHTATSL